MRVPPSALLLLVTLGCATSAGTVSSPSPAADPAARVNALADEYLAALFERVPEIATFNGVPGHRHDRLTDNSLEAISAWERREDAWLAALRAMDTTRLAGRQEIVTYGILRDGLESSVASRVCRGELWGINQLVGWQVGLPQLASTQPVGSAQGRADALARARATPRFIETEITNLREGVRQGFVVPRANVRLLIEQIDGLLATGPAESPFADPAKRDSTPPFREALTAVVGSAINPALRHYRDYLEREYLPVARTTIAVSAMPRGEACYRALARSFSTLDVAPRQIHEEGLRQMARIEGEMRTIAERSFGTSDVRALLDRFKTDSQYTYRTREQVIAHSQAAVDRAKAAMPRWFGILPKADVVIQRYPEYRERTAVGEYWGPAEDGSRPGTFFISTYEPQKRSRSGPESVAFHETIPGHHLQGAIALERREKSHPIARYTGNSGFSEGWALYAEGLADEMGLFTSDLDRMGMLSEQALRATRMVVDPGMHVLGWTRDQAVEYMRAHTTAPEGEVQSEIDRYIIWPGQAPSYMLGMLEIRRLRAEAERKLGPKFDIRAFHDRVLENGSVPLAVLRGQIERWIAESS